jgi:hypothetical protein
MQLQVGAGVGVHSLRRHLFYARAGDQGQGVTYVGICSIHASIHTGVGWAFGVLASTSSSRPRRTTTGSDARARHERGSGFSPHVTARTSVGQVMLVSVRGACIIAPGL